SSRYPENAQDEIKRQACHGPTVAHVMTRRWSNDNAERSGDQPAQQGCTGQSMGPAPAVRRRREKDPEPAGSDQARDQEAEEQAQAADGKAEDHHAGRAPVPNPTGPRPRGYTATPPPRLSAWLTPCAAITWSLEGAGGRVYQTYCQLTQPTQFLPLLRLLQLSFQFNEHNHLTSLVGSSLGLCLVMNFFSVWPSQTRERCSGRQQGLSCSAECPLHADGSIGSVRGLRRPQTTIDASSVVDLSADSPPMCSRPSNERFFMSHVSLLQAADVSGNRLSQNRAQTPPRERDRLGGVSARFTIIPQSHRLTESAAAETAIAMPPPGHQVRCPKGGNLGEI
ncbi:hypothetical protein THAOC_27295, partial [Thalassiosira oceanica]